MTVEEEDDLIREWIDEHPMLHVFLARKCLSYEEYRQVVLEHIRRAKKNENKEKSNNL